MYGAGQGGIAIGTLIGFGHGYADTISELGYPGRQTLRDWWHGYGEAGEVPLSEREREPRHPEEMRRGAVALCLVKPGFRFGPGTGSPYQTVALGGQGVRRGGEGQGGQALRQVRPRGRGGHTGARVPRPCPAGRLAQGVARRRGRVSRAWPRAPHGRAEEGRGQALPRPREVRRPRRARARVPQARAGARRVDLCLVKPDFRL